MTKVVYFSGVHGAGKTSLIKEVENRLSLAELEMIVLPEFTHIPKAPIGSMEFQLDYQKQMIEREEHITNLVKMKYHNEKYDYIFCDRSPMDVDIYTAYILGIVNKDQYEKKFMKNTISYKCTSKYRTGAYYFLVKRDVENIVESLEKRNKLEHHRKDWKEIDEAYITRISELFDKYYPKTHTIHNNGSIESSIVQTFSAVY